MSTRTAKKLLLSLIAIGILSTFTTGGVYAVFVTEGENAGSSISTGTFIMSNSVAGGTACTSDASTSNSNTTGCTKIVQSTSISDANLPGTVKTVTVDITNTGSVGASDLWVSMPGATAGTGCSSADNSFASVHGGGNACGSSGDLFYIEEIYPGSPTTYHCWYPAGAGACSITGGGTLFGFSNTYFFNGTNGAAKLDLGLGASPNDSGMLAPGSTRHFLIGLEENGADNTMQGETATFALLWHMDSGA